jgi:hypothetical protein
MTYKIDRNWETGPEVTGCLRTATTLGVRRKVVERSRNLDRVLRCAVRLTRAGFVRYATYRQAVFAGLVTNTVFGFLRTAIVLTVFTGSARVAGYDPASAVTFVWVGQDLLAVVMIFGEGELAGRVRTGQVSADLLRPVDLQAALLAEDVGRAGFAMLTVPVMIGGLAFTLADVARTLVVPRRRRAARRPGELRAALPAQPHRILAARLAWRAHYLRRHRAAAGWTDHPSAVLRSLGGRDPGGDAVSCDGPDPDRPAARAGRRGLAAGRPAAVGGAAARCRAAGAGAGGALAQRLERHVELLDMAGFLRVPVRQLSLGQRMRGESPPPCCTTPSWWCSTSPPSDWIWPARNGCAASSLGSTPGVP